jgi:hypothetical protein
MLFRLCAALEDTIPDLLRMDIVSLSKGGVSREEKEKMK